MRSHTVKKTCRLGSILFFSLFFLAACSSGGDDGTPNKVDTTPPVVTLNGQSTATLNQGTPYVELGATALDAVDGNLDVTITGSVDHNTVGSYILTYSATDATGLFGTATRTVIIKDINSPQVTLNGQSTVTQNQGEAYVEAGATAIDNVDGILNVTTTGSVDINTANTYTLTYSATDAAGLTGNATRTVIIKDITPPQITLNGEILITIKVGTPFVNLGAIALDDTDGDLEVIVTGTVDINTAGTYSLTYNAKDTAGNPADSVTRTVRVIPQEAFITRWQTDNRNGTGGYVATEDNQIKISTIGSGYNYQVDWGDGQTDVNVTGDIVHTYASIGTYTISINGDFPRIYFSEPSSQQYDNYKLLSIEQWGDIKWESMNRAFYYCQNLKVNAQDTPDLSQVEDMSGMFYYASSLNQDLSGWDVSSVTNMADLFRYASSFNQDLSAWDVSSVTTMRGMFYGASTFNQNPGAWNLSSAKDMTYLFKDASAFNQDLSGWDVSSVTNMSGMFSGASTFNQNLSTWDVSSVTNMRWMFMGAIAFNQDINTWNVSSVQLMDDMFAGASIFNQNLGSWDVSSVSSMGGMFINTHAFNQDLSTWDVSSVYDMSSMFAGTRSFNQDLSSWDVSSVSRMDSMFLSAIAFNQNLGSWDVSSVTDMRYMFLAASAFNNSLSSWDVSSVTDMTWMFREASVFNQDLSAWNVSSVINMSEMFRDATHFNQDIGNWDVSSVNIMNAMFRGAISFNQNLGNWDVSSVYDMFGMFSDGAALSTSNYDALLLGWSAQSLRERVEFHGGNSQYSSSSQAARDTLTNGFRWTVTDGGVAP